MKRIFVSAIAVWVCLMVPLLASAQTSITVLGLRSPAADSEMAQAVTDALRQAAESGAGNMQHTGRTNELGQLMIAFGCDTPTADCLQQIGQSLESDRLLYGNITRSPGGYTLTLAVFDVEGAEDLRTLQEPIQGGPSEEALISLASQFYGSVTGVEVLGELAIRCNVSGATVTVGGRDVGPTSNEPIVLRDLEPGPVDVVVEMEGYRTFERTVEIEGSQLYELSVELTDAASPAGDLLVRCNVPGAEIFVGGQQAGVTSDEPLMIVDLPAGSADIIVQAEGYRTFEDSVEIEADEQTTIEVELELIDGSVGPVEPRRGLAWLGWTSLGLGIVFGGLGMWSSLVVNNINSGDTHSSLYRERHASNVPDELVNRDVCAAAANNNALYSDANRDAINNACNRGDLFNTLQFVFYGLGAVAMGVGIYLVIREIRLSREREGGNDLSLRLEPMVWDGGGSLSATLRF